MTDRRSAAESEQELDGARIRQRLRALRTRYPGLALETSLTHIHDDQVVMRAGLSLPDGTRVTAHAAEPMDRAGMLDTAIELAEQRATTRALDLLGVGEIPATTARTEQVATTPPPPPRNEEATPPVVDALRKASQRREEPAIEEPPVITRPAPTRELPERPPEARRQPERVGPAPREEATREMATREPAPREPVARQAGPREAARTEPAAPEPDMADYSWTDFWKWARANDLNAKGQVEQRIGRSIEGLQPLEVRQLLHKTGIPR